ncbi:hypothetical protein H9639_14195 [Arthrobacter sp. Sa2CUA1]|uniref:Uncharacterized protein n=1 Tax=Arthrobacter gallicola TaxID=2762225 RepID=A0ABR8UVA5_9MICC|nr:hypothetical protein [Arthrobacter gallicola]MBD7996449.1 hypothetical protein [Arthrobacter gallicola]
MGITKTLNDDLIANRSEVSIAEFEASRRLGAREGVGGAASWAVWGNENDDLTIFEDSAAISPRLRKDVVLIGANFGLGGDTGEFPPFKNFHARKSGGDSKLRKAITGTALEGAFLTDIVKDYPTKDAKGLPTEIKSGTLDTNRYVLSGFKTEQEALGLSRDTLYIPMGDTTRILWDLLVDRGVIPAEQRVFHRAYGNGPLFKERPVTYLRHYAGAVDMVQAVQGLLAQLNLR